MKETFSKAKDEKIHKRLDALRRYNDDDGGDGCDECPGPGPPPPPLIFPPTFPTQQQCQDLQGHYLNNQPWMIYLMKKAASSEQNR